MFYYLPKKIIKFSILFFMLQKLLLGRHLSDIKYSVFWFYYQWNFWTKSSLWIPERYCITQWILLRQPSRWAVDCTRLDRLLYQIIMVGAPQHSNKFREEIHLYSTMACLANDVAISSPKFYTQFRWLRSHMDSPKCNKWRNTGMKNDQLFWPSWINII